MTTHRPHAADAVVTDVRLDDLGELLDSHEHLATGDHSRTGAWTTRLGQLGESGLIVGAATMLVGALLATGVGVAVFTATRDTAPTTPRPRTSVPVSVLLDGPSTGDTRQGMTADANTRRSGDAAPTPTNPAGGDSRAGLTADASTRR